MWLSGKESTYQCRRHGFDPWARKVPWRRKWQPIPVFLFRKSHGQRILVGYSPWGCKESDMTEGIHFLSFCFIDYTKAFDCVDHNKLWKILKEMGTPDHLNCLLRNLHAGQESTVRTGHGKTDWFQIGKGVSQGCILSPYLFNLYAECIMRNAGLDEAQA